MMNRNNSPAKQLWAHQPLQSYSRSATDSHERTAILSPVQPVEPRLKRSRVSNHEGHEESRSTSSNRSKLTPSKPSAGSVGGAFENNGNSETQHVENEMPFKPTLKMQPLSLDRGAIAPGLVRATAPFAKSERKRAYVSAIYYSECFLRGIKPVDADMAAVDIQNQYSKWWVQSKNDSKKKRKRDSSDANIATPSSSTETRKTVEELSNQDQTPTLDEDQIIELKRRLFENLQKTGGDTTNSEFKAYCEQLTTIYKTNSRQRSSERFCQDGTWLTLSKPTFTECQGRNENGEYMYTLGRMSFDMFRPTHLKCSIRAVMNNIRVMDPKTKPKSFPSRLAKELQQNVSAPENPIQHYDIVVAFTIEAGQTREGKPPTSDDEFVVPRPIRGLMSNHGYMVADPSDPHRSSIWFSGGSIEVQDEVNDMEIWKQIFDDSLVPRRDMRAMANVLAAKVLLGAYTTTTTTTPSDGEHCCEDGHDSDDNSPLMNYFFKRPIGGHGEVYCDALYEDETLRIVQGHRGSIFVFNRIPSLKESSNISDEESSGSDEEANNREE